MVEKNIKKSKRLWNSRNAFYNCRSITLKFSNFWEIVGSFKTVAQSSSKKYNRGNSFRPLKDKNGSAGSLEFLILLPIILFIIFGSIDYYITQMQYNHLENIKNYYTNIMKVQGTLTDEDLNKLVTELDKSGFKESSIDMLGYNETDIRGRIVYRNIEKPDEARMSLIIKTQPKFEPFIFGRLLGEKGDEDGFFYFWVKGDALSEKSYYEKNN